MPEATAASVVNPTGLRFPASVDHDKKLFDGKDALTEYLLDFVGAGGPPQSGLGKPSPANGVITVPLPTGFTTEGPFLARVGSKGPGGISWSPGSDAFGFAFPPAAPASVDVT